MIHQSGRAIAGIAKKLRWREICRSEFVTVPSFSPHAAAGSKGFELIDYFPSPQTLVGAGFASWRVTGSA